VKLGEEPLCVIPVLEADDAVVGEAHDDHISVRLPPPPPVGPEIEDVVEVDVCEQRRDRCPLRRPLRRLRPLPVLDHSLRGFKIPVRWAVPALALAVALV
jgi:hypothetical protein